MNKKKSRFAKIKKAIQRIEKNKKSFFLLAFSSFMVFLFFGFLLRKALFYYKFNHYLKKEKKIEQELRERLERKFGNSYLFEFKTQ